MDAPVTHEHDDPRSGDPERIVRAHVHVALASIVLTFLAPLVSWTLWFTDRRAPGHTWKRRLLALAIVDTVLVLGLAVSTALGFDADRAIAKAPRIGVVLEAREDVAGAGEAGEDRPPGVVVERVVPNSPAATAELEPGDTVVAVDGKPIENSSELMTVIAETETGAQRRLELVRGGRSLERTVTPTTKPMPSARTSTSLFEPIQIEQELRPSKSSRYLLGAGVLELTLVGLLALAARRRDAPAAPAFVVLAGMFALTLVSSIVLRLFQATIGVSLGAMLVSILSGSVALLGVGLLAATLAPWRPVQTGPRIETAKAIALGIFYGVTGAARFAILLTILVAAFGLPLRTASEAFGLDLSWGPYGVGLFMLATVVVAPVAEEVLFRGVLLSWLARWMSPASALAWSTIIFAFGHLYYGAGALLVAHYGLVFGWARLRTGKLWAPIILHAVLNGATAAALLAAG